MRGFCLQSSPFTSKPLSQDFKLCWMRAPAVCCLELLPCLPKMFHRKYIRQHICVSDSLICSRNVPETISKLNTQLWATVCSSLAQRDKRRGTEKYLKQGWSLQRAWLLGRKPPEHCALGTNSERARWTAATALLITVCSRSSSGAAVPQCSLRCLSWECTKTSPRHTERFLRGIRPLQSSLSAEFPLAVNYRPLSHRQWSARPQLQSKTQLHLQSSVITDKDVKHSLSLSLSLSIWFCWVFCLLRISLLLCQLIQELHCNILMFTERVKDIIGFDECHQIFLSWLFGFF